MTEKELNRYKDFLDYFGVKWDKSVDKDIGNVLDPLLSEPTLSDYTFPDPTDENFFKE